MTAYLPALDQGATSLRAILFDAEGHACAQASQEIREIYPQPGWVEHDPLEIWLSQPAVAEQVLCQHGVSANQVAAVDITNQPETAVVWDQDSGQPAYNAIVWQCRRGAPLCQRLHKQGLTSELHARTGLVIRCLLFGAYFSALTFRRPSYSGCSSIDLNYGDAPLEESSALALWIAGWCIA
jgi:glycerol kinase